MEGVRLGARVTSAVLAVLTGETMFMKQRARILLLASLLVLGCDDSPGTDNETADGGGSNRLDAETRPVRTAKEGDGGLVTEDATGGTGGTGGDSGQAQTGGTGGTSGAAGRSGNVQGSGTGGTNGQAGTEAPNGDRDGDGVLDDKDAFPDDPTESVDGDADGIGDNADLDDDGDGVADLADAFPGDPAESVDTDGDGTGDNADLDDDEDAVLDVEDAFPLDPTESSDHDGDGTGDNADPDDDDDLVLDAQDAFPLDSTESEDQDGDGTGDNADPDDDDDGANDPDDSDDADSTRCSDQDEDGCDDCAVTRFDPRSDGADADGDGVCDGGDAAPSDMNKCRDLDQDDCDDCASGTPDPDMDGEDFDVDGACDLGDGDDDDDGSIDADDLDDHNRFVCSNTDFDFLCDDCTSGHFDPFNDGPDLDGDGGCDAIEYDDDGDVSADGEDNCPTVWNYGNVDQDRDGLGDLCDPSPCPATGCALHCRHVYDAEVSLNHLPGPPSEGLYMIDPDGAGGHEPLVAFCGMGIMSPAGGWTRVLHYNHKAGTNPELRVLTDRLPTNYADLLEYARPDIVFEQSSSWGHASNALIAALEPDELMFEARTDDSKHNRRIAFATDDAGCIEYFSSGIGNCRGVSEHFAQTNDHSGFLPEAADSGASDQGEYAMTELPFYKAGQYHWAIRAEGKRWEVDDASVAGPENATWHTIWVRQRPLPGSCAEVLLADPDADDGVYKIDPDSWAGAPPFDVFCDMTSDGGGFTKILQTGDAAYAPTANAAGDVTQAGAFGKLSDEQIKALVRRSGGAPLYRVQGNRSTRRVYVESAAEFSDAAAGWGALTTAAGPIAACEAEELASCTFATVADAVTFDTLAWGLSADDCDRYAIDPGGQVGCTNPSSSELRCASAGATCATEDYADHPLVEDLSVWIRPVYRSCRDHYDRLRARNDGIYWIDPDGAGGADEFEVFCDMKTTGGGWTLIGKTAAGDYSAFTDQEYIDLIANPVADVNPLLLRRGTAPEPGQIAFWNREKTNALFDATNRGVVRVIMTSHTITANNGTYYQQRKDPPAGWDLWHALRNGLLWSDDPSADGVNVSNFGTDFTLSRTFIPASEEVSNGGDGSFSYWSEATLAVQGGESINVSRHLGLLGDGYGANASMQWLLTADPSHAWWKADATLQRTTIWLR
jgi:hypothetical protein